MKFIFVILSVGVVCFCAHPVLAHPPTDLKLTYDMASRMLQIEMTHVSGSLNKHTIRRIVIYKNQEEYFSKTIARQTTAYGFKEDYPVQAKEGDVLMAKAFCSNGGIARAEYIVPEDISRKRKSP